MDTAIVIALIGAVVSIAVAIAAPALLLYLKGKQEEKAKRLDWDRQDELARRVSSANEATTARLDILQSSADQIHILVNSQMTERVRAELEATVRELVALREIMELKEAAGVMPTDEAKAAITMTLARIAELRASLADRLEAQTIIDRQKLAVAAAAAAATAAALAASSKA